MIEKGTNRVEQHLAQGARAALNVLRADVPRAADLEALLSWVDEQTLWSTWANLTGRSFRLHADPLAACCEAVRAIVADYYSRPPLRHECVSDRITETLANVIGGALLATLKPQASA